MGTERAELVAGSGFPKERPERVHLVVCYVLASVGLEAVELTNFITSTQSKHLRKDPAISPRKAVSTMLLTSASRTGAQCTLIASPRIVNRSRLKQLRRAWMVRKSGSRAE